MGQYAAQQDLAPGMWHQSPPACSLHCTAFWREWKPPLMYVASGPGSRAFLCLTQGPPSEGYYSPPPHTHLYSNKPLRIESLQIARSWLVRTFLNPEDCLGDARSGCRGEKSHHTSLRPVFVVPAARERMIIPPYGTRCSEEAAIGPVDRGLAWGACGAATTYPRDKFLWAIISL